MIPRGSILAASGLDFGLLCACVYMLHELLHETHLGIHLSFSFPTCSAAVRAQHIRRLPKGEQSASDREAIVHLSSCIRIMLQIQASRSFPPSYVPSPGPARTATLRPQFAFEASTCDFFAFQNSSHFLLPLFIEKTEKSMHVGLQKPLPNPLKMLPKSHSEKNMQCFIDFCAICLCF